MSGFKNSLSSLKSSATTSVSKLPRRSSTGKKNSPPAIPNEVLHLLATPLFEIEIDDSSVIVQKPTGSGRTHRIAKMTKSFTSSVATKFAQKGNTAASSSAPSASTTRIRAVPNYLVVGNSSCFQITSLTILTALKNDTIFRVSFDQGGIVTLPLNDKTRPLYESINAMIINMRCRTSLSAIETIETIDTTPVLVAEDDVVDTTSSSTTPQPLPTTTRVNHAKSTVTKITEKLERKIGYNINERLSSLMQKQNLDAGEVAEIQELMRTLRPNSNSNKVLRPQSSNMLDIEDAQQLHFLNVDSEEALEAKLDLLTMKSEISEPLSRNRETNSERLENLMKKKHLTAEEAQEIKVLMFNKVAINNEIEKNTSSIRATSGNPDFSYMLYRNSINTVSTLSYNSHMTKALSTRSCLPIEEAQKASANFETDKESVLEAALDDRILNTNISKPKLNNNL